MRSDSTAMTTLDHPGRSSAHAYADPSRVPGLGSADRRRTGKLTGRGSERRVNIHTACYTAALSRQPWPMTAHYCLLSWQTKVAFDTRLVLLYLKGT